MRQVLHEHRGLVFSFVFVSIPSLAALAILTLGWGEALHLIQMAMAILGGLLFLKASVVFLTIGIRFLL